jgi:HEPN domain-containing protein
MVGVRGNGGAPMPTSKEYRQHAEECLELAKQAEEFYVRAALIELADEFKEQAETK